MNILPFTAFVDLDELKLGLISLAIDPSIGGLLIFGPKGTGKSSIVRAFADLLPEIEVVSDCIYHCDPNDVSLMCDNCRERVNKGEKLPRSKVKMKVVTLPIGATEDMVLGSINVERTLKEGRVIFEPGILARANRNILYVDEVNLLPDHVVDTILDAASSGWNIVEREGVSVRHPSRFILIGTMNPEEGDLRPQLLDRFAIGIKVDTIKDPRLRSEIVRRNLSYESNRERFLEEWLPRQRELREKIINARKQIKSVKISDENISIVTSVCSILEVDGYRPDIVAIKVARALAAFNGRRIISEDDILMGLKFALVHRTRAGGLKPPVSEKEIIEVLREIKGKRQVISLAKSISGKERKKRGLFFRFWQRY